MMMKVRLRYAFGNGVSTFPNPLRIRTRRHNHHCVRSSSAPQLQVPLFLRPPVHSAAMPALREWREWATGLAASVGTAFADSDGGPDSSLLRRELRWLIEDAVESDSGETVRMRASLEELSEVWKERVGERRPFQYAVGCEHWRDLVLGVQEGVLIPRPETETLVDLVNGVVEEEDGGLWADLGTGSGAIAIGIAGVLKGSKGSRVFATDLSPLALSVARYNVQRYCLQDVIELRQGSWFEPLKDLEGKLAGIVSNPPYIPSADIAGLQAEVRRHEPRMALDGGADGMDALSLLCKGAASVLKPGGFFAFETNGEKQCKHLVELMESEGGDCFCDVKIVCDFAGIQRFVTGFRL